MDDKVDDELDNEKVDEEVNEEVEEEVEEELLRQMMVGSFCSLQIGPSLRGNAKREGSTWQEKNDREERTSRKRNLFFCDKNVGSVLNKSGLEGR